MSRNWHKMNNIVSEIERNRERINTAKCHLMVMNNSIIPDEITKLQARQDRLYDDLYDLTTAMLNELEEKKA
jgi:hypothetical protein